MSSKCKSNFGISVLRFLSLLNRCSWQGVDWEKWPVLGRKDWDWEKELGAGTKTKLDFSRTAVNWVDYGVMFK